MNYKILFILLLFMALGSCRSKTQKLVVEESEHEQLKFEPGVQKLDEARQWLLNNPSDTKNQEERRSKMAVLQKACDKLPQEEFINYYQSWNEDAVANALEKKHPALYYLQEAIVSAVDDIKKTEIEQGVAIWYIYNMGYVFKTPDACFGIDIKMRHSEQLADILDFLLITHEHQDHSSAELIDAMISAQKPVITRWREGTTIINEPGELIFGDCRIKVDIGDHHYKDPDEHNNMLMFQVDCGKAGKQYTVYHSGGGNNYLKMKPDKKVDLFIVHVNVGMSVEDAIGYLKPQMTFVSHVMELSHSPNPPDAWRWSFDYAFERVKNIPENLTTVLTWGERWLAPQTILQ